MLSRKHGVLGELFRGGEMQDKVTERYNRHVSISRSYPTMVTETRSDLGAHAASRKSILSRMRCLLRRPPPIASHCSESRLD